MDIKVDRKRKLSPSETKARIVEKEDGGIQTYITSAQGTCIELSFGALSMLHGLMNVVFAGAALSPLLPRVRLPVKRRLDFEDIYDIETSYNDDFLCEQRSPLIKLEVALQNGYLHDGWMTSRTKDVSWLSEYETHIA